MSYTNCVLQLLSKYFWICCNGNAHFLWPIKLFESNPEELRHWVYQSFATDILLECRKKFGVGQFFAILLCSDGSKKAIIKNYGHGHYPTFLPWWLKYNVGLTSVSFYDHHLILQMPCIEWELFPWIEVIVKSEIYQAFFSNLMDLSAEKLPLLA